MARQGCGSGCLPVFFGLLVIGILCLADSAGLIDLDKMLESQETAYEPPKKFGYMWRSELGPGNTTYEQQLNKITKYVGFTEDKDGNISVTGSATCQGLRCW